MAGEIAASAALGGTVSELGGGKFANGAITSAFSVMFNDMMHPQNPDEKEIVKIDVEDNPHSTLDDIATISTLAGTALLADDVTIGGVVDDPLAAACFIIAGIAESAKIIETTVDVLNNLYHTMMAEHTRNARPSTRNKHTKHRPGESYGHNKNQNRGNKNKKHEHPINPNKKRR